MKTVIEKNMTIVVDNLLKGYFPKSDAYRAGMVRAFVVQMADKCHCLPSDDVVWFPPATAEWDAYIAGMDEGNRVFDSIYGNLMIPPLETHQDHLASFDFCWGVDPAASALG